MSSAPHLLRFNSSSGLPGGQVHWSKGSQTGSRVESYHFLPLGAPFLQRPEDCHLDPTLCSTSYAGKLQNLCLIQSFQRSLKNLSPKHRIRICQFPKAIYKRFWKKLKSKELGEKEENRKSDLTLRGGKKNHPQSLFLPSICATDVRHLFGDKALNVNWMH